MSAARQVSSIQQELHAGNLSHIAIQTRPQQDKENTSQHSSADGWTEEIHETPPPSIPSYQERRTGLLQGQPLIGYPMPNSHP